MRWAFYGKEGSDGLDRIGVNCSVFFALWAFLIEDRRGFIGWDEGFKAGWMIDLGVYGWIGGWMVRLSCERVKGWYCTSGWFPGQMAEVGLIGAG